MDPADLTRMLPEDARPMSASDGAPLPTALQTVVGGQPEFAGWIPSELCLFNFRSIDAGDVRVSSKGRRKAPMLAFWTVPVTAPPSGAPRHRALGIYANTSRLDRPGTLAGIEVREISTRFGPVPDDLDGRPSNADRYTIRIGKTQLTWDGRAAGDSSAIREPLVQRWRAAKPRGGTTDGALTLSARTKSGMIGSLKVEGKDALAEMLRKSPIRFVGPGYRGGDGTLTFTR